MQLTLVLSRLHCHPSMDLIHEFQAEVLRSMDWNVLRGPPQLRPVKVWTRSGYWITRCFRFLFRRVHLKKNLISAGFDSPHYFVYRTFPWFSFSADFKLVWLYDAWPEKLAGIANTIRRYEVNVLLVSSKQATERLREMLPKSIIVSWLPEAIDASQYISKPWQERGIDVVQFGRKWQPYHEAIRDFCHNNGVCYQYERAPGEIIFPSKQAFLEGLADSKICVCVPSSITHPARGDISTMTIRYLQAMASKCLVVGRTPPEMEELFGYDPVVQIDLARPTEQLEELLGNFESFLPLIERNYRTVTEHHQWKNRLVEIEERVRAATLAQT